MFRFTTVKINMIFIHNNDIIGSIIVSIEIVNPYHSLTMQYKKQLTSYGGSLSSCQIHSTQCILTSVLYIGRAKRQRKSRCTPAHLLQCVLPTLLPNNIVVQ